MTDGIRTAALLLAEHMVRTETALLLTERALAGLGARETMPKGEVADILLDIANSLRAQP